MTELEKARQTINSVDEKMARLFIERMEASKIVAAYKQKNGLRITDAARENDVIRANCEKFENEEFKPYYIEFLKSNIKISKSLQSSLMNGMKVAFSGVEGAFAEIAASYIFPNANYVPHKDFKSAYISAENGECDCVLLPIENSFNGDVEQVMDLAFFGSLYINGIYDFEVVQNLLAVKGAKIEDIKQVISHPQALGQCDEYLREYDFELTQAVNTAVAVKLVAEKNDKATAAIGSREAAEKYGLNVLEPHINRSNTNTTRFAVFSKTPKAVSKNDCQFVMVFTVKNESGALGRAIKIIGDNGFNLRALKSRPTKELIWNYYFYVEGEGNIGSEKGRKMLKELEACCNNLRVLGSFDKETTLGGKR